MKFFSFDLRESGFKTFDVFGTVATIIVSAFLIVLVKYNILPLISLNLFLVVLALVLGYWGIVLSSRHSESIYKVNDLMKDIFGLHHYVESASKIYAERDTDRVVTSLGQWVSTGDFKEIIVNGISKSTAKTMIILGNIEWNRYLPGVLWRFNILKEHLESNNRSQEFIVYHVDRVPLFVVSKKSRRNNTEHPNVAEERGKLLVGNPIGTTGTKVYGLDLGKRNPNWIDYYNFLFDVLLCPKNDTKRAMNDIYDTFNIRPPEIVDGIQQILQIEYFRQELISKFRIDNEQTMNDELLERVSLKISHEINLLENPASNPEEASLILNEIDSVNPIKTFLRGLISSKIISPELQTSKDGISARYIITNSKAKCENFFPIKITKNEGL